MDQNNLSQLVGFAARSPLRHVKLALPTNNTVSFKQQQRHTLSQSSWRRTAVRLANIALLVTNMICTPLPQQQRVQPSHSARLLVSQLHLGLLVLPLV